MCVCVCERALGLANEAAFGMRPYAERCERPNCPVRGMRKVKRGREMKRGREGEREREREREGEREGERERERERET